MQRKVSEHVIPLPLEEEEEENVVSHQQKGSLASSSSSSSWQGLDLRKEYDAKRKLFDAASFQLEKRQRVGLHVSTSTSGKKEEEGEEGGEGGGETTSLSLLSFPSFNSLSTSIGFIPLEKMVKKEGQTGKEEEGEGEGEGGGGAAVRFERPPPAPNASKLEQLRHLKLQLINFHKARKTGGGFRSEEDATVRVREIVRSLKLLKASK